VVLSDKENRVVCLDAPFSGRVIKVVVKSFGRRGLLQDQHDLRNGSRAERAWCIGMALRARGAGTPEPLAFLDLVKDGRLLESYHVTGFVPGVISLTDQLIELYHDDPDCAKFMVVLQIVADAIRRMHDAGVVHNDLGNQNILLRRTGPFAWDEAQFVDLDRGRVRRTLTPWQRGRDIARIALPSDFLRVFKDMYFERSRPPLSFHRAERLHRYLYTLHHRTRRLRHPFREAARERASGGKRVYPEGRDIWVWDDMSGQASVTLSSSDRHRLYPLRRNLQLIAASCVGLVPVWRQYRKLSVKCFRTPVPVEGRVGVAIEPQPDTLEQEMELLDGLGPVPVIMRFYRHRGEESWRFLAEAARQVHARGHSVAAALVQDRKSAREPDIWRDFVESVLEKVGATVEFVEAGHAMNRVKWGIWDFNEYRQMLEITASVAEHYPQLYVTGPAAMDFDFVSMAASLRTARRAGLRLGAASHHLYVDRNGAPETRRRGFGSVEKFVLGRAVAEASGICNGRFIVSEVNWPLEGTGVYSPVGSPYESPGPHINQPNVSEAEYAAYMLRYVILAAASGMVDRVYWWRLAAHGFGMVDDICLPWRTRMAYTQLRVFLNLLGRGLFVERIAGPPGTWVLVFDRPGESGVCVAWSEKGSIRCSIPIGWKQGLDAEGREFEQLPEVTLSGSPVYLLLQH